MASIQMLKNTPALLTPAVDYIDSGWDISGGYASHYPCNPGYIINNGIPGLTVGKSYEITYRVLNWTSGTVRAYLGNTAGTVRNANGTYTETLVASVSNVLKFYSDGFLTIGEIVVLDPSGAQQPVTVAFSEKNKLWVNKQSVFAEAMARFGDDFFAFKGGQLWLQNSNPVRNNFFGQQYTSQITFYINADPVSVKLFHNIIEESNGIWEVLSAEIKPYPGKPLGMNSRIKTGKFKQLNGLYYAEFLRNILDPRFSTEIEALLRGEELRGRIMEITIQNSDTTEVTLSSIDVKYSKQNLTP